MNFLDSLRSLLDGHLWRIFLLGVWNSLRAFRDARLWRIFLLGISSGFPWLIIGSGMSAWLKDEGLSRGGIGLFGVIFVAYTINFLWAPVVDHLRLPFIGKLGQRRSWILLCQSLLVLSIFVLSLNDPSSNLFLTAAVALVVASVSATQDLPIDAYRITVIREDEPELIGHGAAMATCGWWTGASLPGVLAFWLADDLGWPLVYQGLALFLALLTLVVLAIIKEPARPSTRVGEGPRNLGGSIGAWFDISYVDAVAEFFRRNGAKLALGVLGFIFLFKIGEAFLGRMAIVFYKEVGFTSAEIGTYSKGVGWVVIMVCSIAAGILSMRFGVIRMLFVAGIAMASTNLLFSWIALVGPDTNLFAAAVILDGITGAFATVAFVAFISEYTSRLHSATQYAALASPMRFGVIRMLFVAGIAMASTNLFFSWIALVGPDTNLFAAAVILDGITGAFATVAFVAFISEYTSRLHSATQYAALASLGNSGRTLLAASSGFMVTSLGGDWALFFVLTAFMVAPSLLILGWISHRFRSAR